MISTFYDDILRNPERRIHKMSRSYHKTPYCGFEKNSFVKKWANKRVRHKKLDTVYNYAGYKKFFDSYEICDYHEIAPSFEHFRDRSIRDLNRNPDWANRYYRRQFGHTNVTEKVIKADYKRIYYNK